MSQFCVLMSSISLKHHRAYSNINTATISNVIFTNCFSCIYIYGWNLSMRASVYIAELETMCWFEEWQPSRWMS